MHITWLGQSGFIIEYNGTTIVLDPYLSTIVEDIKAYRRLMPPVILADKLRPDLLFFSHNHFDHFDPITAPIIINNCPHCIVCGPASVPERAITRGITIPEFNCLHYGDKIKIGDIFLCAVPARHSDYQAIGLLIETQTHCIYFSGDTLYYPNLAKDIKTYASNNINMALLCINGKGGNMNVTDASRLAVEIKAEIAVPTHYGMFAENTVDPEDFTRSCTNLGIKALTLHPGIKISLQDNNQYNTIEND